MSQATIHWEEIRKRLRKSEDALEEALSDTPERMKAVFRQRAAQLAGGDAETKPFAMGIPALIFRLARERYAVALKDLAEVAPFKGCTQVPGAPPQILGVINLRGELRPVIDLSRALSGSPSTGWGAVLVLHRQAVLKVDSVEELREIRADEVTPPVKGRYVRALVSGTLALLDVETMLSAVYLAKESRSL